MPSALDAIEALAQQWEPRIRDAFVAAVRNIADKASLSVIEARLREGDIEGAIRAVGLDENDFVGFLESMRGAYGAGGGAVVDTVPAAADAAGATIKILFNMRSPRAELWLQEKSSTLVREIVADQRETIRGHLVAGMEAGVNPRTSALDLVGRMDKTTGKRAGGVIGLTSSQEKWQRNYAREVASSDPAELKKALDRGLRDKRFDGAVKRAIAKGAAIPEATQAKMIAAYRARSLKYRADTIARTETIRALGAAQAEAYEQAIERGQVEEGLLRKFWLTSEDDRVREEHRQIPGMNKGGRAWREAFDTPSGPSMHAPHDRDIQCRCKEIVRIAIKREDVI